MPQKLACLTSSTYTCTGPLIRTTPRSWRHRSGGPAGRGPWWRVATVLSVSSRHVQEWPPTGFCKLCGPLGNPLHLPQACCPSPCRRRRSTSRQRRMRCRCGRAGPEGRNESALAADGTPWVVTALPQQLACLASSTHACTGPLIRTTPRSWRHRSGGPAGRGPWWRVATVLSVSSRHVQEWPPTGFCKLCGPLGNPLHLPQACCPSPCRRRRSTSRQRRMRCRCR